VSVPTPPFTTTEIIKDVLVVRQHTGRENKRCVIFVHGLTGNIIDTWKKDKLSPRGFVELLLEDRELLDYDIGAFGYRSTPWRGAPIDNAAIQLKDALSNLPANRYDGFVLIAHSMGGLVCMRYILNELQHAPPQPPVEGLLLYGTPTTGSDLINIAKLVGYGIGLKVPLVRSFVNLFLTGQRQVADLATGSAFLSSLLSEWAYRVVNGGHEKAGRQRMWLPVGVVTGEDDKFVKEASGKGLYGAIDWVPLSFDHIALVKPEKPNDPRYRRAKRFLEVCRTQNSQILERIWSASQEIWASRTARVSENLDFTTVIYDEKSTVETFKELPLPGFGGCETLCEYDFILERDEIEFGISIGDNSIWDRDNQPVYVHQIGLSLLPSAERDALRSSVDEVLSLPDDDEQVWLRLFPKLAVTMDGIALTPGQIVPQDPRRVANWMLRKYRLPPELEKKIGARVRLKLNYHSVVPLPLSHFVFSSPWIINIAKMVRVVVYGDFEYFVPSYRLVPAARADRTDDVLAGRGEATFSYDGVLLPGSAMEVRWRRRKQAEASA
jgi:pimeloyl-ACP methyl ester carboxylesterase